MLDPGIGFGKHLDDNLDVQRRLSELRSLGLPLLLGVSRKSFIGQVNERDGFSEREASERVGGRQQPFATARWRERKSSVSTMSR